MVWIFSNSALNFDSISIYFNLVFSAVCLAAASEILEIFDFLDLRVDALRVARPSDCEANSYFLFSNSFMRDKTLCMRYPCCNSISSNFAASTMENFLIPCKCCKIELNSSKELCTESLALIRAAR